MKMDRLTIILLTLLVGAMAFIMIDLISDRMKDVQRSTGIVAPLHL